MIAHMLRVVLGLFLIQAALPKVLPLPGISPRWLVIFVDGGVLGILASIVGGVVILTYGASLLPRTGWSAWQWGAISGAVAIATRLLAVLLIVVVSGTLPVHYPWDMSLPPALSLIVALALSGIIYAILTAEAVSLARRATKP